MNARFARLVVAAFAIILVGSAFVHAETNTSNAVNIKFKFIAGSKMLDPGNYTVDVAANGSVTLTPEKGSAVELPQVKDLGNKKVNKLEVVFEEMGSMMYLSEVWVPAKPGTKVGSVDAGERRQVVSPKNK